MNYIINLLKNKNSDLTIPRRFNLKYTTMNENIDLTKVLKDCPKGTKFYSSIYGEVEFDSINIYSVCPIVLHKNKDFYPNVTKEGRHSAIYEGECTLFPSKDQRDWSRFTAPWYKNEKFDPETLKPFDRVLVRNTSIDNWACGFFSHIVVLDDTDLYNVGGILYDMCIPYNDETKHLVGTKEEAPEYYKYW